MVTSRANADDGDKAVDEGSPSKPQPKAKAGAKKTVCMEKGQEAKKKLPERVVSGSVID